MELVLTHTLEFAPERDKEILAAVPEAPAVFVLRGEPVPGNGLKGSEPYITKTANLRRRLMRLLSPPEHSSKRLNLRSKVRTIEYALTGSEFESGLLLYRILRREFPATYAKRPRLRPAPLVRVILDNEYPRATVTTRIRGSITPAVAIEKTPLVARLSPSPDTSFTRSAVASLHPEGMVGTPLPPPRSRSLYYGPFATRAAAEKFSNDALDFFKMRRCVDDLHPDPAFPGCIYSEMKMCLAPCFRGCTDSEYHAEVSRVEEFLETRGQSLVREISAQRDEASAALEFENAAALHQKLEKLTPVIAQLPEIVRRIDRLNGIVVQPSAHSDSVSLFRIEAGRLNGPLAFALQLPRSRHSRPDRQAPPPPSGTQEEGPQKQAAQVGAPQLTIAEKSAPKSAPQSMEARLAEALAAFPALPAAGALETMEHLAYLKRWYYRTSRSGEIFFTDDAGELPMRRVVRGISRVFRGEKPAPELNESAGDYWIHRGRIAGGNNGSE